jgi:hypothetical protein
MEGIRCGEQQLLIIVPSLVAATSFYPAHTRPYYRIFKRYAEAEAPNRWSPFCVALPTH